MWQAVAVLLVLGLLFVAGLLFVNHSLYKDFEGKDPVVQVKKVQQQLQTPPRFLH